MQVRLVSTDRGATTHVGCFDKHGWPVQFSLRTQRSEYVKCRVNPPGCGALPLPWTQPLQALAEVVVEEEI